MSDALAKVAAEVYRRRLRLRDTFADFDRLRTGLITKEQFSRGLGTFQLTNILTPSDVDNLQNAYGVEGKFCYAQFCTDVDVAASHAGSTAVVRTLSPEVEAALRRMYEFFGRETVHRGLELRRFFADFDKHHMCKITVAQFERCFPFRIEANYLSAIEQKYGDGNGKVYYLLWCSDVESTVQSATQSSTTTQAPVTSEKNVTIDVATTTALLRNHFISTRTRIEDVLKSFDKHHTGLLTPAQFEAAVGACKVPKLHLTTEHFKGLVQRYAVTVAGVLHVDYKAFAADVDPPSMLATATSTSKAVSQLDQQREKEVEAVLAKIRSKVDNRRLNLRPTFHDFDRAVKGIYQTRTCTRTRFERALAVNHINLSSEEYALLQAKYAVADPSLADGDAVNYDQFCRDIESGLASSKESFGANFGGVATSNVTGETIHRVTPRSSSAEDVLNLIRHECRLRSIRIAEFLRDFDPLRSGFIAADKLKAGISMCNIRLLEPELQMLVDTYANPALPGTVKWAQFLHDLEKQDDASLSPRRAASCAQSHDEGVAAVLARVRQSVKSRGILLPPFFQDYDIHHCGRITRSQFQQTVVRHKLPVAENEIPLLFAAYQSPVDREMVDYVQFIVDVDDTESRDRAALSPRAAGSSTSGSRGAATVEQVVGKIARHLQLKSVRLGEFFADYDPLRKRAVPGNKFCGALSALGLILTDEENNALVARYAVANPPGYVDYITFVEDVQHTHPAAAGTSSTLSSAAQTVVSNIASLVRTRRLNAKPTFADFDKHRCGRITKSQFFSALSSVGIDLTPGEAAAVVEAFGTEDKIRYVDFCTLTGA